LCGVLLCVVFYLSSSCGLCAPSCKCLWVVHS
jgi:hypothetical protein